jgi:ATP adenylyltransferase
MKSCLLCNPDPKLAWNRPLVESPNFLALPSLGSLVEGWMLILPKKHVLSLGALPDSLISEFQVLKTEVVLRLRKIYGKASVFEHGPSGEGRTVGCGVDHAHLHLVPIDFDLADAISPYISAGLSWSKADLSDCRKSVQEGDDYLYFEQPVGNGWIIRGQMLGSQLFRRAIADRIGTPGDYNWRLNAKVENIESTISAFSADLPYQIADPHVFEHAV